ncbi:hypothetical protein ACJMK2_006855 [Sinanodonta woodiana]|uniref:RING-type E3 ubiquitin transferase n=1 Tax=Sinanodonta woodiana TaxID=1069815 RepID=A0ABD3VXY2_SINWO
MFIPVSLVGFVSPQIIWTSSCLPVTPIVLCSNTEDNLQGDKEAIIKTLKMQMTPKAVKIDSQVLLIELKCNIYNSSQSVRNCSHFKCIEYSGGTNNEELTEINPKGKFAEIMKRSIAETDCATFSRMGQLENLHKSLKGDNSLSASEDIKKKRECSSKIKRKAVDNVSEVKYKMFRFFFSDLNVSFFKNVCVRFSEDEGCIYVEGKNQKTVDEIIDIITNAFKEMDTFQESVVHIKKHKQEYAKQLVLEMNSSSPKGNVFCYLDDLFDIHIFARTMNEVQAAKHKINLKLGDIIIKGRQKILFSTFNDNDDNKQASSSSSKSLLPNNTRAFMTDEGIKVFVYNCPILRAPVDVIVNAANADLKHTGGVSKVIADAAGREFISESQTYIKENGNLNVGSSCITQGGNLSYTFVIHTVGPDWSKYSKTLEGLQQCKLDLWKAVIGSFFKAEILQVQSIALPAVSSGMYGVPMEICASQYLSAVLKYSSSTQGQGSLKEIHFIDVNKEILYLIQLVFSASLENNKAAAEEFDRRLQRVISNFGCHSNPQTLKSISSMKKTSISSERFEPHYVLKEQKGRFHFSKVFKVLIYTGDITDSTCQAIVSSEDKDLMLQGGVAKAIRSKAGQTFDQYLASNRGRHLQVGDVIEVDGANLKRKVICCIIPEWSNKMSAEDYEKELRQCFRNILEKVKTYKSVALPLFGTGEKDNNFAIYGRVLLHCLLQFSNAIRQTEALMEVHIVSHDEGSIVCVTSIFTEYFDSEKMLDAESTKATYKGVSSTTFSKEQGQPPLNSSLESRNTIKGRKSGEHTKARVEADMGITENLTSSKTGSDQPLESQKIARDDDSQDNCVICFVNFDDPVKMNKCGHLFCKSCIDSQLQYKPICPVCGTAYGIITGNQPKGTMTDRVDKYANLEGYEGCGVIQITYNMPSGAQGEEHPKPGHPYHGLYRSAYLPNNKKGQKVLHLLHLAFDRRLIFTIGRSVTSGKEDMVTWNDIHHKTSKFGGPQKYGYPDPTYLDRVLEELAAKGVTEESEQQDPGTFIAYERVTLETRF